MTNAPAALRDRAALAARLLEIADLAAGEILRVYAGADDAFGVEYKSKDDPVTKADKAANAIIVEMLEGSYPGVPIVAEESPASSYEGYAEAGAAFFVDPLDGTRDFVARTGDFAVMIGLAEGGRATFGVVHCAARGRIYVGGEGAPARVFAASDSGTGGGRPIRVSSTVDVAKASLLVSRSRPMPGLVEAMKRLGCKDVRHPGSAGVKGAMIAEGEGDVFAHAHTAGSLWDSCAPEAIVRAAGGVFTHGDGSPFDYRTRDVVNTRGVLAANPTLHARLLPELQDILAPR